MRCNSGEVDAEHPREGRRRCGKASAAEPPVRRPDPHLDRGFDRGVPGGVVGLRHLPSAAGSQATGPAGGAAGFRARPELHLGASQQSAGAHRHANDHHTHDYNAAARDHNHTATVRAADDAVHTALLYAEPDAHLAVAATPAGARSGADIEATRQLIFARQRNSPLHWRAVMITLDNVSKKYKASARPALEDINVKIDKGEFVFLIGPSGSGKSTFMRLLLAEETPNTGDIRVSKFHVNKLPGRHVPKLRQVLGCVFQDFRLLQQKTVFENVAFALEVIGKRRDAINRVVPDVLETVGLSGKANRLPHELSGGEQQRVAIARAFVNRPLVLLADEPTGNLDPDTSKDIMDLLERINRTGTTVLMATHDHHIVDSMRQRVVELSLGRLVRDEQRGIYGMDR
jgi:cell division ATP-binding protein FtsE